MSNKLSPYQRHKLEWESCTKCPLCETRNRVVLVRGSLPCDVLFSGEAPGHSEDILGKPFVGPAGQLLDDIIAQSLHKCGKVDVDEEGDDNWYPANLVLAFTNLVGCIPLGEDGTKTAEPSLESIKACSPRLRELVIMAKPKLIVTAGKLADEYASKATLSKHISIKGIEWISITHPAAIIRAPQAQQGMLVRKTIETLSKAMEKLC